MKLGVTLPQFTDDPHRFLDGARRAEALGFHSAWVLDHLWPLGAKRRPIMEAWTGLAAVAAVTKHIGIGTLVTRSSLRHPAVLAKMAATVATVAPGRLTVAVGSGDGLSRSENEAFGLPYYPRAQRGSQLASTLRVLVAYFEDAPVSRRDDFVAIDELPPSPTVTPPASVWVGGWSHSLLRLAGAEASGWNGWGGSPGKLERAARAVRAAGEGRFVEISWGGQALLAASDAFAVAKLGRRDPTEFLVGGPETMAGHLRAMANAGAEHLILAFPDAGDVGPYELLALEVAPLLALTDIPPRGIGSKA